MGNIKMKNKFVFGLVVLLLFVLPLTLQLVSVVSGQGEIPGIPTGFSPEELERRQAELEKLRNVTEWQYLGQRFKESLLKNPVISEIDSFCSKPSVSIVFRALFGMPYELSITLLFVIALWLIVFIDFGNILGKYYSFSAWASYGISFGIAVIFSQVQIFRIIVNFVGTLVFSREAWWARVFIVFSVILFLLFIDQVSRYFASYLQKLKEAREKKKVKAAGEEIKEFARGIEEGREIAKTA